MKKTLLILSVFLSANCIGQKDAILAKPQSLLLTAISVDDGLTLLNSTKQDTVRVLMLVCDTASVIHIWTPEKYTDEYGIIHPKTSHNDNKPMVWWQFGYEVIEGAGEYYNSNTTNSLVYIPKEIYRLKEYLDQNKKPLNRNIVVWITKEIKQ